MPEKQITINRWDLGIADERRDLPNGFFRYLQNVNCGDDKRGLKQIAISTPTTNTKGIIELITVGAGVYGLGWDNATDKDVSLWKYSSSSWTESHPATGYALNVKARPSLICDGTYIYYDNNTKLGRYTLEGGAQSGDWYASGGSTLGIMWQGDIVINKVGNVVQRVTIAGAAGASITIPTGQTPVDFVDMGNLLGIICNAGSSGFSKMYIWDGVNTSTFYDIIPIGRGYVAGGVVLEGVITVVVNSFDYKKIIIKRYDGRIFRTSYIYNGRINSSTPNTYTTTIPMRVKTYDDFMYILIGGTVPLSTDIMEYYVARYGRKTLNDNYSFSIYKNFGFAPAILALVDYGGFVIQNANVYNELPIMASVNDTSEVQKLIMPDTTYASQAGVIETSIYTGGNSSIEKKLQEMSIQCSPLTSGQSIALYYKSDADASWTEITTINTVGTISYEPAAAADGTNFKISKEVAFRFLLLGGAEITGFDARYEPAFGQR